MVLHTISAKGDPNRNISDFMSCLNNDGNHYVIKTDKGFVIENKIVPFTESLTKASTCPIAKDVRYNIVSLEDDSCTEINGPGVVHNAPFTLIVKTTKNLRNFHIAINGKGLNGEIQFIHEIKLDDKTKKEFNKRTIKKIERKYAKYKGQNCVKEYLKDKNKNRTMLKEAKKYLKEAYSTRT